MGQTIAVSTAERRDKKSWGGKNTKNARKRGASVHNPLKPSNLMVFISANSSLSGVIRRIRRPRLGDRCRCRSLGRRCEMVWQLHNRCRSRAGAHATGSRTGGLSASFWICGALERPWRDQVNGCGGNFQGMERGLEVLVDQGRPTDPENLSGWMSLPNGRASVDSLR